MLTIISYTVIVLLTFFVNIIIISLLSMAQKGERDYENFQKAKFFSIEHPGKEAPGTMVMTESKRGLGARE